MPFPKIPELPEDDPIAALRMLWKHLQAVSEYISPIRMAIVIAGAVMLFMAFAYHYAVDLDPILSWASDFVPLALAVVGIILSLKKLNEEHHSAIIVLLIVVGITGTVVLHLSRTHEQANHAKEVNELRGKMDTVRDQNAKLLQAFINQGPQTKMEAELQRRQNIEKALRGEYILSHDNVSPGLLAGTEFPPDEWMNRRLRELGEKWAVASPPNLSTSHQPKKVRLEASFYTLDQAKLPLLDLNTPLVNGVATEIHRSRY